MDASLKPSIHFTGKLYPFQKEVLKWSRNIKTGILGLDMGLGKTPITIAIICEKQYQRVLVVLPLQILEQWRQSLLKFTDIDNLDICVYQGRGRKGLNLANYRVILTTYDVVRTEMVNERSALYQSRHLFDCLVLDEAHRIRNNKTLSYQMCYQLAHLIANKWLLTGTTIHNKFTDFSTLCDFLDLKITGPLAIWRKKYYYRLTKSQCLELPEKSIHEHYLAFGKLHFDEYMKLYDETKELYENYLTDSSQMNLEFLMVKILRLRQCCNHPDAMLDEKYYKLPVNRHDKLISAKYLKTIKIIEDAPSDDKLIVFSQWTQSLRILGHHLKRHKIDYLIYDGSKEISERNQVLNEYKTGPIRVLLITLTSGGVGLDITVANHMVILDSWWNQALEDQAIDRIYRIGQEKKVEVHRLYMRGSIDEWMVEMKKEKKKVDISFHDNNEIYSIDKDHLGQILHMYI